MTQMGSTNHKIEVDIVQAQILQRRVDRFENSVHSSVIDLSHVKQNFNTNSSIYKSEDTHFGGNSYLLSRNLRISDPLINFLFVFVSKPGVDMTIIGL